MKRDDGGVDSQELLAVARERIRQVRTAEVALHLVDEAGHPVCNAAVSVQLTNHAFKFGCGAFGLCTIDDAGRQQLYDDHFVALFNYATLPFYWGTYEPYEGAQTAELEQIARWCRERRIPAKGHPLIWHEVYPEWLKALPYEEALALLERRVRTSVAQFADSVRIWDVFNEATVTHKFDTAIAQWVSREGIVEAVATALQWAREANPDAVLLYNDFNISEDFERLVAALLDRGASLDAIGIQSHMHTGAWTLERVWEVCETYARFGLPLHFTELTLLSGRLKEQGDDDWHTHRPDWFTTPEGEVRQAEQGEQIYTMLFSHPAVEAITWWDLADYCSWMLAPSGLLRRDMSPKPLYERLMQLVRGEWRTDVQMTCGGDGVARCRCFFGEHRVTAELASGERLRGAFDLRRDGERALKVVLQRERA